MRERSLFSYCFWLVLAAFAFGEARAQMGFNLDVKKPEPYDNRVLKAEKTPTDKKIKLPKRFFANLTTHYNYFFNANNKLNEVIERAKGAHKDDYSTLLPFYNYSLDITAGDEEQLDSVIYKSQTGVVMHDLRSDWVDNMYLLWGAAHYFQKEFDSAYLMFQFINYAFADKEKDGYYRYIGSRLDGNSAASISTREDNSLLKKAFSRSPSRNEALLWQVRSLIELNNLTEAGSLIVTLRNDPSFPERLHDQLEEVHAYWFYRQEIWDSAATHLLKALDVAKNKQEKGRWEYLAAQLFEKTGNIEEAAKWYDKAIGHGTDPVMDVYARLNLVRINKDGGENYIEQNIAELLKMAKRERFSEYRDIIYFMAAQMELDRGHLAAAQELFLKAAKYNNGNLSSRSAAFLMIADLAYEQRKYVQAASFYDSIQSNELKEEEARKVEERKPPLVKVVAGTSIIERQDSLQRIASMPEEERKAYITKLVKKLRKQQGLSEESASSGSANPFQTSPPADLFTNESKGEWYFYNSSLKTGGATQFKQTWGNRPNADNWRRFAQVSGKQPLAKAPGGDTRGNRAPSQGPDSVQTDNAPSYGSLLNKLPLTPELLQASNDSINTALFSLGNVYLNEMEDYISAIETFEKLRSRSPNFPGMEQVYFGLSYAYSRTGNAAKAAEFKNLLTSQYPGSRLSTIMATGKDPAATPQGTPQATKDYEAVYDMFLEGRFEEAVAAKKTADSIYQTNKWQPQLLYIEALYNVKQRNDSAAKNSLNILIAQNSSPALSEKAKTMLDVLSRRQQIEDELNRLQIERPKEDTVAIVREPVPPPVVEDTIASPTVKKDNAVRVKENVSVNTTPSNPVNTAAKGPVVISQKPNYIYKFEPSLKHYAVIVLNKVDAIFSGEAKNAFSRFSKEKYYSLPLTINVMDVDSVHKFLIVGDFNNAQEALDYIQLAKRLAPSEIVPWLKPDKYSFSIISPWNMEVLQNRKDLEQYRQFLEKNLPGKL